MQKMNDQWGPRLEENICTQAVFNTAFGLSSDLDSTHTAGAKHSDRATSVPLP